MGQELRPYQELGSNSKAGHNGQCRRSVRTGLRHLRRPSQAEYLSAAYP
jgi:hypothetical protein